MCGRYALTLPPDAVRKYFRYPEQPNFPPRYNIAPTQPVPVVRLWNGARQFVLMRWGFLPGFVKEPKEFPLVINIRTETVREKPSFRNAFNRRRALMPVDGFYEWHRIGKENRPYLLRRPDRGMMAFAALWETWHEAGGSEIDTAALVNTHANGAIAAIHHRSPVILDPKDFDEWLDPDTDPDDAYRLLRPPPDDLLELVPISSLVNKVANDMPDIQVPASAAEAAEKPDTADENADGKPTPPRQGSLF
jgi:putative SOS response-associated peptidase YedK